MMRRTYERIHRLAGRHPPHFIQEESATTNAPSSSAIIRNIAVARLGNRKRSFSNGYFNPQWVHRSSRSGSGSNSRNHGQRASTPHSATSLINFNQFLTQHNLTAASHQQAMSTRFNATLDATINMAIELMMQNSIAIRRSQLDNRVQQRTPPIRTEPVTVTPAQDFSAFISLVQNNSNSDQRTNESASEGIYVVIYCDSLESST